MHKHRNLNLILIVWPLCNKYSPTVFRFVTELLHLFYNNIPCAYLISWPF